MSSVESYIGTKISLNVFHGNFRLGVYVCNNSKMSEM